LVKIIIAFMSEDNFILVSQYKPKGDQPQAIEKLVEGIRKGYRFQTLLGVTGSGKTYTMANVIARVNKPTLIICHNKTLAAQLYSEFRDLFPYNRVEYFVSYYDYYQPEAYVPQSDLYIEKDADINEDLVKLRHKTLRSLMERRDTIVVSSVSCIYGWDDPTEFLKGVIEVKVGQNISRKELIKNLVMLQYERNDIDFSRGKIRVRGDIVDVYPIDTDYAIRIEFFGDTIDRIYLIDPLLSTKLEEVESFIFFPAKQFLTTEERILRAVESIKKELNERVEYFLSQGKNLEAERLKQRTNFDIEMLLETGYVKGIENYTRHLSGRKPGEPPYTIIDYFPSDFLIFIDESHITVPQLRGMYNGDRSRKETLVEYGFRLPSCLDNRPLKYEEFLEKANQIIFVSATPTDYELSISEQVVEQLIRPTGLIDPEVEVRKSSGQIEDLIREINERVKRNERILVTTLTKRVAEDLATYLYERGIRVRYLHSDIDTIERAKIIRDLRKGEFDCLVGINLLREGLDLPEVSLVAILDADKEGFLRSHTSLIQIIGRAARNVSGKVIMYADEITESMKKAIEETNRRRKVQMEYNIKHGIKPETVRKAVKELIDLPYKDEEEIETFVKESEKYMDSEYIESLITQLEEEMHLKAETLEFEEAARIRDKIFELKKRLRILAKKERWIMILSVILNPFVEEKVNLKKFQLGGKNQLEIISKTPGGRGINAARFIKKLGGDVSVLSIIGGKNGEFIKECLNLEKIDFDYVLSDEENPLHLEIFDERGVETDFFEKDPVIAPIDVKNFEDKFREKVKDYNIVLLTDGTPNGICKDIFKHLIQISKDNEKIVIFDAKGEMLKEGLKAEPFIARIDKEDFDFLTGSNFISLIKRFKSFNDFKPEYLIITVDKGNLIFNYEDKFFNLLSKDILKDVPNEYVKDLFIASLSYYLDEGVNFFDSLKYSFYISTKSVNNFVKPKNIVEVEKEIVLREI